MKKIYIPIKEFFLYLFFILFGIVLLYVFGPGYTFIREPEDYFLFVIYNTSIFSILNFDVYYVDNKKIIVKKYFFYTECNIEYTKIVKFNVSSENELQISAEGCKQIVVIPLNNFTKSKSLELLELIQTNTDIENENIKTYEKTRNNT